MTNTKSMENNNTSLTSPRESLVRISTAVHFLQNPNIRHSPLSQKQKFLQSKGLTKDEIQIACEKAGVFTIDPNSTVISMDISTSSSTAAATTQSSLHNNMPSVSINHQLIQKPTLFIRIKNIFNSVALIGSFIYVCYLFYKKFIESFLFGKKRKKTLEEKLDDMNKKIETQLNDVNQEIIRVRDEILTHNNENEKISKELNNFKGDLDAIKGLLLNRKQFANSISVLTPSIPAWQLQSQQQRNDNETGNESNDKNDDTGSGSGSSETEVVTKNSDSSLELV